MAPARDRNPALCARPSRRRSQVGKRARDTPRGHQRGGVARPRAAGAKVITRGVVTDRGRARRRNTCTRGALGSRCCPHAETGLVRGGGPLPSRRSTAPSALTSGEETKKGYLKRHARSEGVLRPRGSGAWLPVRAPSNNRATPVARHGLHAAFLPFTRQGYKIRGI